MSFMNWKKLLSLYHFSSLYKVLKKILSWLWDIRLQMFLTQIGLNRLFIPNHNFLGHFTYTFFYLLTHIMLQNFKKFLNLDSHLPKKIHFICFNESPLKKMKNVFHFILKALFVLNISTFLLWLFGHVGKTAILEI